MSDPIGYLVLAEPTTFTRHYETACNYALIEVPAGEYPVVVDTHINGRVRAALPGTLTKTYFVNRLFTSSSTREKEPMTPDTFHWGAYDFQWRAMVERGEARNA